MLKVIFVLRGRPGLGHVIPGLAIAQELINRGHQVLILTYNNGSSFLNASRWENWINLKIKDNYFDWPGLNAYNDGLRTISPILKSFKPDLLVLGGEYLLGLLANVFKIKTAMIFNPEIFEKNSRNDLPAKLLLNHLMFCDILIPLKKPEKNKYYSDFKIISKKIAPFGPFLISRNLAANKKKSNVLSENLMSNVILIANGGGINFPSNSASYSTSCSNTKAWIKQTYLMTISSIESVLEYVNPEDNIYVFSCLGKKENCELKKKFNKFNNIKITSPSLEYYDFLDRADLIISRAGAGFLADAASVNSHVIFWPLAGHDEQISNIKEICQARKKSYLCETPKDLKENIRKIMQILHHQPRRDFKNHFVNKHKVTRVSKVVDYLLEKLDYRLTS